MWKRRTEGASYAEINTLHSGQNACYMTLTWSGCTRSRTADRVKYSIDCINEVGEDRCCGND